MKSGLDTVLGRIATLGFIGYLPVAPGTWGALAGLGFIYFVKPSPGEHAAILAFVIAVGVIASSAAERMIGSSDSGHIVIDEFAGFLVSVFSIPHTPYYLVSGFILFRFFDIIKPLMISKLEKTLSSGPAVMADDILAGVYANLLLHLWIKIF